MAVVLATTEEQVVAAWQEYLRAVREAPQAAYEEVEPWAWLTLRKKLKAIGVA